LLVALIALFACGPARAGAADSLDAGPLFDEFQLTLAPGHRMEAAGPLFYEEQQESLHTWALPPLFSHAKDPEAGLDEYDFLYPVLTYDRYGGESRWQFFQLLSYASGRSQTESYRSRFTLFPLYFQQRSSDPAQNYTAVAPFYGHLQNRLFRDEIFFVMFPGYSRTRKGEIVTDNYLYPFYHLRHGPGLEGWQLWPLLGHEHKTVTTRTNGFSEVEIVPGHDNRFVLWPFYYNTRTGLGTDTPAWQQGLLPAYALLRSPQRDSTTVLWPFFSRIEDREKNYHQWDAAWPFIEFARGPGKTTTRFWPLFSRAHNTNLVSNSYLWPLYTYNGVHADPLERGRARILFFLYGDTISKNTETGASRRRVDLWPLFIHQRDYNGNTRLQVLAVFEPWMAGSHKIERDYSPLWSLWRAERNPRTEAASQSLLWNLYRRDATPRETKVSALFGLFQYRTGAEGSRLRLFYVPVKGSAEARTNSPAHTQGQ
jgi:hypothetical protein